MGIVLFIVARFLQWLLSPLFFIFAIIKLWDFEKISKYFYDTALGIDQLGNIMGAPIMNSVLLTKNPKLLYGDPDQTISYVTGINYYANTLTRSGKILVKILNFVDKNHVQNAVKNESTNIPSNKKDLFD